MSQRKANSFKAEAARNNEDASEHKKGNNKNEEVVRAALIHRTIGPSRPTPRQTKCANPVYRFVDGAIASTYDLRLSGLLDNTPRPAPNACFTSLKMVRRF